MTALQADWSMVLVVSSDVLSYLNGAAVRDEHKIHALAFHMIEFHADWFLWPEYVNLQGREREIPREIERFSKGVHLSGYAYLISLDTLKLKRNTRITYNKSFARQCMFWTDCNTLHCHGWAALAVSFQ